MSVIKSKLFQILSGDSNFCNFCLKNIDQISFSFNDEVVLENKSSLKIVDLITSCLGAKYVTFGATEIICKHCTSMLLNTYKFTNMCKNNTEQLYKLLENLESIPKFIEHPGGLNSVFLILNPASESNQIFYDDTNYENSIQALEGLQLYISNMNCNVKFEVDVKEYSGDSDSYGINLENKTKKVLKVDNKRKETKKNKIPLAEIIQDPKNMSKVKCKLCDNVSSSIYNLRQHFLREHAPKVFQCAVCLRSYGSASLLTQHKKDCHLPKVCPDCGKCYSSRTYFKLHMESHTLKLMCQICGKTFKYQRSFDLHIKLNICDYSTRKKRLNKSFVCDYCSKGYSSKPNLRNHIKFAHGNGTVHICSCCNKKFHSLSRLKAHIVTHTGEKKFSCDLCDGWFVTKESLLYHTRIHTGDRPYQCEYCELRFLSSSRRADHVRRHHNDPMIECDICHKKFREQSCLTRHKNRHFNPKSRLHYTKIISKKKEI